MSRTGNPRWLAVAVLALLVSAVGCGGGKDQAGDAGRGAELEALRAAQAELTALRQQKSDLEAAIAAFDPDAASDATAEEGATEGEEAAPTLEGMQAEVETLEATLAAKTDEFGGRVVAFINADPPIQGEPMKPEVQEAIHMKTAEDMIVAQEYIDQGGDYRRALDIFEQLQTLDPDNEDLAAAIAKAEEMRYMTPERFAQVKKGMTMDEVRAILGQVNLYNVKNYEDKGVISWLYPREDKGAAGVYYNEKKGEWRVYQLDFDAVKAPAEGEAAQ